jgi:hypothetical protein
MNWLKKLTLTTSVLLSIYSLNGCKEDKAPSEPEVNHPPTIERIVASPSVPLVGEMVNLTCIADDEDGDNLIYRWSGDGGYFNNTTNDNVVWNTPDKKSTNHINVEVDDRREGGLTSKAMSLEVISKYDTIRVTKDTFTSDTRPTGTFGIERDIVFGHYSFENGLNGVCYAFLEFGEIPLRRVNKASLILHLYDGCMGIVDYHVHKIIDPWDEFDISWENMPNYESIPSLSLTVPEVDGENCWWIKYKVADITDLVNEWVDYPSSNYGFVMTPVNARDDKRFISKEGVKGRERYDLGPGINDDNAYDFPASVAVEY